jgi:hypothetical protein
MSFLLVYGHTPALSPLLSAPGWHPVSEHRAAKPLLAGACPPRLQLSTGYSCSLTSLLDEEFARAEKLHSPKQFVGEGREMVGWPPNGISLPPALPAGPTVICDRLIPADGASVRM